jgi:hypothetical protein
MTQDRPSLQLNRLIIRTHSNAIAYDEVFHSGVNIIRGNNSSGKSTISNFIFYVLGGDYRNWTTEALKCKEVIAEVFVNSALITLKREVSETGSKPMSFYWGNYEKSSKDSLNWQTYPYKQTENQISFSNVLFNALSFPEVKSQGNSNITIHQILRLLYIDQDTPTQSLFRFERFDLPLTREAISEILLGVYDDELYNSRLELKDSIKSHDEKKKEYDSLNIVFSQTGNETNVSGVNKEMEKQKETLNNIDSDIIKLREKVKVRTTKKTALNSENVQESLIKYKNEIRDKKSQINQFDIEIADSKQFIATLEKRIFELNSSLLTKKVLGELPLTHCPQCLSKLDPIDVENSCHLCKQPLEDEAEKANAKRLLQEMQIQVKESKSLLDSKSRTFSSLISELPITQEKARIIQKQLDSSIENPQTTRDENLDSLLIEKGGIEKNIEFLSQQLKTVELLELLKKELGELSAKISKLKIEIQDKETLQKRNHRKAINKISDYTLTILKSDLDRQEEFNRGNKVEIDFLRDSYSLDGGNNFSASSKIYFKNSILFSILFASLEFDFFRYPRFILCDNMEDKGMEKIRTQNFQNIITKMSNASKTRHQIIFTTSMISEDLNTSDYCVGKEYNIGNKTLEI